MKQVIICANCATPFEREIGGRGRPRKYCTDACRIERLRTEFQPEWYKRKLLRDASKSQYLQRRRPRG